MMKTAYHEIRPFKTKDGALVRELMHPNRHGPMSQSLAEATLPPGSRTLSHRHGCAEEIYHVTRGEGTVCLGETRFRVCPGDTLHIPPGTPHHIENQGAGPLKILCCCSPPYSHDDTELL
jgi:mannose-6-phosphate isomerase-like protein (cupin superfamily)